MNVEKLLGKQVFKPTIAVRFYLLQLCPSAPSFVFSLLFIPSFNVLNDYFNVLLYLVAVSNVLVQINIVTQLL